LLKLRISWVLAIVSAKERDVTGRSWKKVVLTQNLSSYNSLKTANKSQLLQYELVGRGTGVHWPLLDEDLSLKGFLQNELRKVVKTDKGSVAA
jgi:hypothetical protein